MGQTANDPSERSVAMVEEFETVLATQAGTSD